METTNRTNPTNAVPEAEKHKGHQEHQDVKEGIAKARKHETGRERLPEICASREEFERLYYGDAALDATPRISSARRELKHYDQDVKERCAWRGACAPA